MSSTRWLGPCFLVTLSACGGASTGRPTSYPTPVLVTSALTFSALETSQDHACAASSDGRTWCWGKNQHGELGTAAPIDTCDLPSVELVACSGAPQPVVGAPALVALAAGVNGGPSCGLSAQGHPWCWGFGLGGQIGDGQRVDRAVPVAVAGDLTLDSLRVSLSGHTVCGLTAAGAAWCWGVSEGLFGDPLAGAQASAPVLVDRGRAFAAVDLGELHACGLAASGQAWCWGGNWYGQLGLGSTGGSGGLAASAAPAQVVGGHAFTAISTGSDHSCALDAAGAAWCWGLLGGASGAPAAIPGGQVFTAIASGWTHACGLTAAGQAWCWGQNDQGDLGDGTTRSSAVPVRVLVPAPVARLSHRPTCALSTAGEAWCWGDDTYGQVGRTSRWAR